MAESAEIRVEDPNDPVLKPVGIIRNGTRDPPLIAGEDGLTINESCESAPEILAAAPDMVSEIILEDGLEELLAGIEEYSHLIIIYWGHEVGEPGRRLKKIHPAGLKKYPLKGIYATFSPARPNPVLMTVVKLIKRDGEILTVQGLDAINNSPVLDIKPYVAELFSIENCSIPGWMKDAMKEFETNDGSDCMAVNTKITTGTDFCSDIFEDQEIKRLKRNPRSEFVEAIRKTDAATCLLKTAEIHGHFCPGSALGVMASLYGLSFLGDDGVGSDGIMEDLLAIVEVNACFSDGVQAVSGCTIGNNSLIYRDFGKHAVTFAVRGKEEGVRIRVLPAFREYIEEAVPEFYPMMEKVIMRREGGPSEVKKFRELGRDAAFAIIKVPFEDLLEAQTVIPDIPDYAPITGTLICPVCGEQVMATKVWKAGLDKGKCFQCTGKYSEVEGSGIVVKDLRTRKNRYRSRSGSTP